MLQIPSPNNYIKRDECNMVWTTGDNIFKALWRLNKIEYEKEGVVQNVLNY